MFRGLKRDIKAIRERDPAARSNLEALLLYPGLHALMHYRVSHWCYRHRLFFLARLISQWARFLTGTEIHPGAKIGRGVLIDHAAGVVIGETAEVGDGCTLYQGVTLGGTGKDCGKRHPTIGENVMIGCGAKILGPFSVGDGAKIAANAVLLATVPEGATAAGIPARVVRGARNKVAVPPIRNLEHSPMQDALSEDLSRLQRRVHELECSPEELQREKLRTAGANEEGVQPGGVAEGKIANSGSQ